MAAKKDDPQANTRTQPARKAVSRTAPDVTTVKTTPGRTAVKRAPAASASRRPVAAPHAGLVDALGASSRVQVARRRELKDSRGEEGIGYLVKDDDGELCRFVVQGGGLLGALVDSLRFELEDVFEWLTPDGALLGYLTVTWKDAVLVDADDRVLCTMGTGRFAQLTRMSWGLRTTDYPEAFPVFEGDFERPLFSVGLTRSGKAVPVAHGGRTWAWVERTWRDGLLVAQQDGLALDSNPSFPAEHRLWAVVAMAASDYLVQEYEARGPHVSDDD